VVGGVVVAVRRRRQTVMSATDSDGQGYDSFSDDASTSDAGGAASSSLRRFLTASEKVRNGTEVFLNDIHDAYSFDLNPEYRLKLAKRFPGFTVGARFDFKSGDCRLKLKQASGVGGAGAGRGRFWRFWRCFKKVEVQPEDGDVEVFTRPLQWGLLSLQAIGQYKSRTGSFNFRWKLTSTVWETTAAAALRRVEWGPGDRIKGALRWDIDIRPPKAEGGIGEGSGNGLADVDIGSYHVAMPRVEIKVDLSRETLKLRAAKLAAAKEDED
jgi:solute carrier family 25 protein 38